MYADQGMGFLALEAWKHGGPFNIVPVPQPQAAESDPSPSPGFAGLACVTAQGG